MLAFHLSALHENGISFLHDQAFEFASSDCHCEFSTADLVLEFPF